MVSDCRRHVLGFHRRDVAELQQLRDGNAVLADVVQARLVDDQRDRVEVGDEVVLVQRAQRVEHELRIVARIDPDAHAVLQVNGDDLVALDDDCVGRAACAILTGQVADADALLNQKFAALRILADQLHVVLDVVNHGLVDGEVEAVNGGWLANHQRGVCAAYEAL